MPLRRGGGGGGRGLKRLVPSSHERSESRHKFILHLDSLREKAIKMRVSEMSLSDDFCKAYSLGS